MDLDEAARSRLDTLIGASDVTLFMKGTRQQPQCGFSSTVIQILDTLIPDYQTVDVLADQQLRENIKVYSSWPTIPQLYVKGEFVGGCDIIQELFQSGELAGALGIELPSIEDVSITISDRAAEQLRSAANSLALRSAQAALAAAKGTGYVQGHPAGRWCREALFFLVWSCPQPVMAANLCELAGISD